MASEIRVGSREVATWLVASAALLGLAVVGEPFLVPLVFSLLLWAVFNAAVDALVSFGAPRALAFSVALVVLLCAIWLALGILGDQATALAGEVPGYWK